MLYEIIKIIISAILIAIISEISKRSTLFGAVFASVPLVSVLAMIWLYVDTKNTTAIVELSNAIFWLVIPSLILFITLPLLLKLKIHFYSSLTIASGLMIISYFLMIYLLRVFHVKI